MCLFPGLGWVACVAANGVAFVVRSGEELTSEDPDFAVIVIDGAVTYLTLGVGTTVATSVSTLRKAGASMNQIEEFLVKLHVSTGDIALLLHNVFGEDCE